MCARASSLPSHTPLSSPFLSTQEQTTPHSVNTNLSNRNKAGLPLFIKKEIEQLFQNSSYPPKCTKIVDHLNKDSRFCPFICHLDMSTMRVKVQNYIGNCNTNSNKKKGPPRLLMFHLLMIFISTSKKIIVFFLKWFIMMKLIILSTRKNSWSIFPVRTKLT